MAASLHVSLKSGISPFLSLQSQYSASRWSLFCSDLSSAAPRLRSRRLIRITCRSSKEPQNKSNGDEPPESLFMKELRKRGMNPTSLLEETKKSGNAAEETKYREEDGGFSQRNAVSMDAETKLKDQLQESRALNSEGLEGLIPRARLLITLGGTFFLAFWPLILVTAALFSGLYLYFGSSFIHDGTDSRISLPDYIDPYLLLEQERISETAPSPY